LQKWKNRIAPGVLDTLSDAGCNAVRIRRGNAIAHAASRGLEAILAKRYRYQEAGVMLLDLSADANRQLSLDDIPQTDAERQRSQRLMATVDKLNRELGRDTVRLGLPRQGNAWGLRWEKRTSRCTTRYEALDGRCRPKADMEANAAGTLIGVMWLARWQVLHCRTILKLFWFQ
jgi:hypothetical protein